MEIAFEIEFSFSFRVFSFFPSRARQMFASARFTDLSDLSVFDHSIISIRAHSESVAC